MCPFILRSSLPITAQRIDTMMGTQDTPAAPALWISVQLQPVLKQQVLELWNSAPISACILLSTCISFLCAYLAPQGIDADPLIN